MRSEVVGHAFLESAELLPEGGGVAPELFGDLRPLEAAAAEGDERAFVVGERVHDALPLFVLGETVEGAGVVGLDARFVEGLGTQAAASLLGTVLAGEFGEFGLDHFLEVPGDGGFVVELEFAGGHVVDEGLGDGLADVEGFTTVAEGAAHAGADVDSDEAQEFGERGIASTWALARLST